MAKTKEPLPPPTPGQKTRQQGRVDATSAHGVADGFDPPPSAAIDLYRRMRRHPTLVMARAASTLAIKAAAWSVEVDEDVPEAIDDQVTAFLQEQIIQRRIDIVRNCVTAIDFGRHDAEKVWDYEVRDGRVFVVLKKLKLLLPEKTEIRVDALGNYTGLKNEKTTLDPEYAFTYTYDKEGDDFYGQPRLENCRKVWHYWEQTMDRLGRYVTKVAKIVPIVRYPPGKGRNEQGQTIDNFKIARQVLESLSKGIGAAMPDTLPPWARRMAAEAKGNLADARSWTIDFLEATISLGDELVGVLSYLDKLIARGYLTGERAVMEAVTAGSRADSGTAADLSIAIQQETLDDILRHLNWYVVDQLVRYNWPDVAGKVRITATPLDDDTKSYVRSIVKAVLENPNNADLFTWLIDFDRMLDEQKIPIRDGASMDGAALSPGTVPTNADPDKTGETVPPVDPTKPAETEPADPAKPPAGDAPDAGISAVERIAGVDAERAVEMCTAISRGEADPVVVRIVLIGMGFTEKQADEMIASSIKFKPATEAQPVVPPGSPPKNPPAPPVA